MQRTVALQIIAVLALGIAALTTSYVVVFLSGGSPPAGHPLRGGLEVDLVPSTFLVESRTAFHAKAITDVDPTCNTVSAVIPDLGYSQSFTRKDLLDGIQGEINPPKVGIFEMVFSCNGREIGAAPLSVVIGTELAPSVANLRWVLSFGKIIYREDSFYSLPLIVSAEERRGKDTWVPKSLSKDASFVLRDRNAQLTTLPQLTIEHNTAISKPSLVPFPVGADYALVAFNNADGKSTNEVRATWKDQGPQLELKPFPQELVLYAAPVSTTSTTIYLASNEMRVTPSQHLDVLIKKPPTVKTEPSDKLTLTRETPLAICKIGPATASGEVTVGFKEPSLNLEASVLIHILSPARFLVIATVVGLVGVVVARGKTLFTQAIWLITLELLTATASAFLLYAVDLQGWLKPVGLNEFTLSYIAAACIGMVGGYLGLAVFKGVAALFNLFP